jgi:hypothetical protein
MSAPIFHGRQNDPGFTENGSAVQRDSNAILANSNIGSTVRSTDATLTLASAGAPGPDDLFADETGHLTRGEVRVPVTTPEPAGPNNDNMVPS